jgi:CRP-like cAMP-binding protein
MLLNIVVAAWIIGSITLLIVKGDEKTGEYRDQLETLHQYGEMHHFDGTILDKLKRQLRLEFNNREIADEQVLKNFPSSVRRKILRRLYLQPLLQTRLMKGVRQAFVDAFLTSCKVEIFSPGEEIVERGSVLSDLFLLVGGIAEITTPAFAAVDNTPKGDDDDKTTTTTTAKVLQLDENGFDAESHLHSRKLTTGDFIGEIGFFTESPQVESVCCLTVCKTLTMSRTAYQLLAQEHPASVGKILQNLLVKVGELSLQLHLPKDLSILRAGSQYDPEAGYGSLLLLSRGTSMSMDFSGSEELLLADELERKKESLTAVEDLVKMYLSKQLDDQTTRLLFAASRGDTQTINLMCDQGFDPNSADYDNRTALMVASMKGNTNVVRLLLEYKVRPKRKKGGKVG